MNREMVIIPTDQIGIEGAEEPIKASLEKVKDEGGLLIYDLQINCETATYPKPITLKWKVPAINIKGVWKPTSDFSKRIQADWELDHMESRISIDAPVISLFGNNDSNIFTFACSNAINKLEMNARLREEDSCFHCHITFFTESQYAIKEFSTQLRLDYRAIHFSKALKEVSKWWETFEELRPTFVPRIAKKPLYSTWYQFHQNLDVDVLLNECRIANQLGYEAIIIDDGWQTNDSNRGYDYTGDWQAERIVDMKNFVDQIHQLGMKVGLWYSVPFCGKKSKAYQRFKGKFLTEDHRWAPVFDPRYPEVREYLTNIYLTAAKEWGLDGFKLDFIDDFKLYPDTPLGAEEGRDTASINEAVNILLTDVIDKLRAFNPNVFVEFRQKYTGPAMRKFGNMFRAFDCPSDPTMNRVRIADIKMLCGDSAVHSDMVKWHFDEPVELAALHMVNTLFGVPQLSIMLSEAPTTHLKMVEFYTSYWNTHAAVLMQGDFIPENPLGNYPTMRVTNEGHIIIGVYDQHIVFINDKYTDIDLINAQVAKDVVLRCDDDFGDYLAKIYDCQGNLLSEKSMFLSKGLLSVEVPTCGMVQLQQLLK